MLRRTCSRGFLVVLITALGLGAAHGKECKGVAFPEQIQSAGSTLELNGLGLRQATFLKVDVYVAGLYVPQTSGDADAILSSSMPKTLILHFVRGVDGSELSAAWDEGFEKNAKAELPALEARIERFKGLMTDMASGQRLQLAYTPGTGVRVEVDGAVKGTIEGDDFAHALFAIWLGPHPPNAGLKSGLLGGGCG